MKRNGPEPITVATPVRFWSFADFKGYIPPEQHWFIDELFPSGSLSLLAAREKTGKTHWLVDCSCSVATGEDFLGRETEQANVALIVMEDHIREIQSRVLTRLAGVEPHDTFFCMPPRYIGLNDEDLRIDNDLMLGRFRAGIVAHDIKLICLDPLRELHDGAENDADDMAPTLRALRDLAHELDIAIIISHHAGRESDYRGSTAIGGAVDQICVFKRDDHQGDSAWEEGTPQATLRIEGRYGPRQIVKMTMDEQQRWQPDTGTNSAKKARARARIVDTLREAKTPLTADEIAVLAAVPAKTVRNNISTMLKELDCNVAALEPGNQNQPWRYRYLTVDEVIFGQGVLDA